MKNSVFAITASIQNQELLENMVIRLADRHFNFSHSFKKNSTGWKAIETASVETHTEGQLNILTDAEMMQPPFNCRFFFTCIKMIGKPFEIAWATSLS